MAASPCEQLLGQPLLPRFQRADVIVGRVLERVLEDAAPRSDETVRSATACEARLH